MVGISMAIKISFRGAIGWAPVIGSALDEGVDVGVVVDLLAEWAISRVAVRIRTGKSCESSNPELFDFACTSMAIDGVLRVSGTWPERTFRVASKCTQVERGVTSTHTVVSEGFERCEVRSSLNRCPAVSFSSGRVPLNTPFVTFNDTVKLSVSENVSCNMTVKFVDFAESGGVPLISHVL